MGESRVCMTERVADYKGLIEENVQWKKLKEEKVPESTELELSTAHFK